jgi:hypothetical protein
LSSILKALKKLEDEFPTTAREVRLPELARPRSGLRRWEIHAGRFSKALAAVLVLLILGSAALVWYLGRTGTPPPAARSVAEPAASQPASDGRTTVKKRVTAVPLKATLPAPPAAAQRPAVPKSRPTAPPDLPAPRPALPEPVETEASLRPTPAESPPARGQGDSLPVLGDDLKLQALSWSAVSTDRIAVINGSVVREGALLEGYSIVRIDEDQVVVRKGGDTWKLLFDLSR